VARSGVSHRRLANAPGKIPLWEAAGGIDCRMQGVFPRKFSCANLTPVKSSDVACTTGSRARLHQRQLSELDDYVAAGLCIFSLLAVSLVS
jgi:hypothetical protein